MKEPSGGVGGFVVAALVGCFPIGCTPREVASDDRIVASFYAAELETEHGEPLPFSLEFERTSAGSVRAWIHNGPERIEVPKAKLDIDTLELDMPHYASHVRATWNDDEDAYVGVWTKRRSAESTPRVPFRARKGRGPRFASAKEASDRFDGAWRIAFEGDPDPALARFEKRGDAICGTFLTTTGDYRYLAGGSSGNTLKLSCFDGAHAFLFDAKLDEQGEKLDGMFWYGNWGGVKWIGERDENFELKDPFSETEWVEGVTLKDLSFPDLDGNTKNLASDEFAGRARIIQVFGSWCPNCHDASNYLRELHERYGDRGLSIVALAFELTGDFDTDRIQVQRSIERHKTPYPVLLAGVADKPTATKQLRALSFVKSYPTTIFLDARGTVRKIHTGFTGPATGDAYTKLRTSFETLIEQLLAEAE